MSSSYLTFKINSLPTALLKEICHAELFVTPPLSQATEVWRSGEFGERKDGLGSTYVAATSTATQNWQLGNTLTPSGFRDPPPLGCLNLSSAALLSGSDSILNLIPFWSHVSELPHSFWSASSTHYFLAGRCLYIFWKPLNIYFTFIFSKIHPSWWMVVSVWTSAWSHVVTTTDDTCGFIPPSSPPNSLQRLPLCSQPLLQTPSNHSPVFCLSSVAFSRMSHKWNHIGSSIVHLPSFIQHNECMNRPFLFIPERYSLVWMFTDCLSVSNWRTFHLLFVSGDYEWIHFT